MKLLNQLERRMYRLRVEPFFQYLIFAMGGVYLLELFFPQFRLISRLMLFMPYVYHGEIWRLVTFLVLPPAGTALFVLISLYFYYFIGTNLESRWGARRFLLFYLIGALGAILAAFLTGIGTNQYLYLSMFFAFAIMHPELQVMLFFMIPVKMKWLALFNAAFYLYSFIIGSWPMRAALVLSLLNIWLFFGGDMVNLVRSEVEHYKRRRRFRNSMR